MLSSPQRRLNEVVRPGDGAIHVFQLSGGRRVGGVTLELGKRDPERG